MAVARQPFRARQICRIQALESAYRSRLTFFIAIELAIVIAALIVITTGLRAIRADIERVIDGQQRLSEE